MLWVLLGVALVACGNGGGSGEAKTTRTPRFPADQLTALLDSCDYVDLVFYELDFSMSMSDPRGVKYALAFIGQTSAIRADTCEAIGRMFYQIRGRNAAEADIFFSEGCTYLEFYEGGRVVYANAFSEAGLDFFNGQFERLLPNFTPLE